ncbi:MAG: hypothetical protein ACM32O_20335 [Clostridia bacterium]
MKLERKLKEYVYSENETILEGLEFTQEMARNIRHHKRKPTRKKVYIRILYATASCLLLLFFWQSIRPHPVEVQTTPEPARTAERPSKITPLAADEFLSNPIVKQAIDKIYTLYPEVKDCTLENTARIQMPARKGIVRDDYHAAFALDGKVYLQLTVDGINGEIREILQTFRHPADPSIILSDAEMKEKGQAFLHQLYGDQMKDYQVTNVDKYQVTSPENPNPPYTHSLIFRNPNDPRMTVIIVHMTGDVVWNVMFGGVDR